VILGPKDYGKLSDTLRWLGPIKELIVLSADRTVSEWALRRGIRVRLVPRKESYGKMAWHMQRMEALRQASGIVVFFNGKDRWLKEWMKMAESQGKDVYAIPVREIFL